MDTDEHGCVEPISPEDCWKLAGGNAPGTNPNKIFRPGRGRWNSWIFSLRVGNRVAKLYAALDFIFAIPPHFRQSRHIQQKWVWQTLKNSQLPNTSNLMLHIYGVYRRVSPEQEINRKERREHKELQPTVLFTLCGLEKRVL
jgi:hypothetical protein